MSFVERINFNSLKTKMFFAFLSLILVLLMSIVLFINNIIQNQAEHAFETRTTAEITQIDNTVSTIFDGLKQDIKMLSENRFVRKMDDSIFLLRDKTKKIVMLEHMSHGQVERDMYLEYKAYGTTHPTAKYTYGANYLGSYTQYPYTKMPG